MAIVWLTVVLLLTCLSSSVAKSKRSTCKKLSIRLCQGLGYKWTMFPNPITKIQNQKMTARLEKFYPQLTKLNCTKVNPLPFFCSVYAPKCFPNTPNGVIPPCRRFCQDAVGNCPRLMTNFGIQWPQTLDCSRFPEAGSGTICINESNLDILKSNSRRKIKNKKTKDKKNINRKCCRFGGKAAKKGYQCSLTNITSVERPQDDEITFSKRVLNKCQTHEASFNSCCTKQVNKLRKNELKRRRKQERKKKKELRRKNKQEKKEKKTEKRKKQSRKGNKKMKKGGRKMKKVQLSG